MLIDFENFKEVPTEEEKLLEMQSLPAQLIEDTGRCGMGPMTSKEKEELDDLIRRGDEKAEELMRMIGKAEEIDPAH